MPRNAGTAVQRRQRPPCPFLPGCGERMTYRDLQQHGPERGSAFYLSALKYGNFLWQRGHAGRAILAMARALYAQVPHDDAVLQRYPLPYAAIRWVVATHTSDSFPGNPRISFQHQAQRLGGKRSERLRSRAWAAWAAVRAARPELPGDDTDGLPEPALEQIEHMLLKHGHPGEAALWREAMDA